MQNITLRALLASLAVTLGACSGLIDELPTTPDPVISTETFNGTLTLNGAQTHTFFTGATGTITATLTALTPQGEAAPEYVGFSMGTQSGSTCNVVLANDRAVVTSIVTGTVSTLSGSLCMRIYDVGKLTRETGSVDYTFTVSHP